MILGFVRSNDLTDWQNAPSYLPQFQFYERHRAIIRTACPEKILSVIARFDIQQDVVVKTLMSVRQLPQRLRQKPVIPFGLPQFYPTGKYGHRAVLRLTRTILAHGFWP